MRKATKTVAMWFGIVAGIAGLEHGYFEILQGNTRPASLAFFPSMGASFAATKVNRFHPKLFDNGHPGDTAWLDDDCLVDMVCPEKARRDWANPALGRPAVVRRRIFSAYHRTGRWRGRDAN